ncbi:nucleic acid/nucleotide deaminase domain-containing protein [Streptomyces sp. NBC_01465]|uniref:nucleic acid/nucleotide deaminase domain-containing protein n=1 Tax=Streptomyces sp. NBC_01465 TaxID=2903878 RepID=UPI002E31A290|nr:nucleic acid/nucleotide deaminase domain-containing protein [Streptomyces sp. NBC_01465]
MPNPITKALENGAEKLGHTLGERAGKVVKDLYHDTGTRLKKVADNHAKNDIATARELEKLAKREDTPIYHMADDGSIRRLNGDRTHSDLTDADRARLGLDEKSIGRPVRGERNAALKNKAEGGTKPRPQASSQQVPLGSTDLAQATQLARHADNSYGTHLADGSFTSNNYAAARVTSADGSGDFILVGRSNGYRHSERMIGTPFLREGEPSRIRELYTERSPCNEGANCSAWMAERFPGTQVSHSVEYGNEDQRKLGNSKMEAYLDRLRLAR